MSRSACEMCWLWQQPGHTASLSSHKWGPQPWTLPAGLVLLCQVSVRWMLRAWRSVVHTGYGRCLVARTSQRDRSLMDLNTCLNAVTMTASQSAGFPEMSVCLLRNWFWSKCLFLPFVAVAVSTHQAPPCTFRAACLLLLTALPDGDILRFTLCPLQQPQALSPTSCLYCPPQILPLTALPALCLAFLIFAKKTESIQAVESCKTRELSYSRLSSTLVSVTVPMVCVQHGLSLCQPILPFQSSLYSRMEL